MPRRCVSGVANPRGFRRSTRKSAGHLRFGENIEVIGRIVFNLRGCREALAISAIGYRRKSLHARDHCQIHPRSHEREPPDNIWCSSGEGLCFFHSPGAPEPSCKYAGLRSISALWVVREAGGSPLTLLLPPPFMSLAGVLKFDQTAGPPGSRWVPPKWMTQGTENSTPTPTTNGLGQPWDPKKPVFNGVDLTKPDPRLPVPGITISTEQYMVGSSNASVAFVNVNILDSTGKQPYIGDVLVSGAEIAHVGGKLSTKQLDGARVIEGNERTLMSGMVDAHAHFSWTNAPSLDSITDLPLEEHAIFTAQSAQTFLDCGYTMCFGAASARDRLDLAVKKAIQNRTIPGPRFLANGREMAPADGSLIPGITRFVESKEDIIAAVNDLADMGIDQCKLSMSGEEMLEHLRAEQSTFPDEMVAAGVEAAHARGMRVCSHARSDAAVLQCLQYGVDMIYHASFISDATMDALEAQKERVFVAPALNFPIATLEDAEKLGYTVPKSDIVAYEREVEIAVQGLKEMHKRGIRVLPGGDYGFAWTPHGTYHDLEHFVNRLGMSPMDAILTATAYGGVLMGHPDKLGKVVPGAFADLLLVNGNPLEDISLLSHKENLDVIMINGRLHKFHQA
ncbi:Amidohydro-rel domain-containing protein [Mycena chlorophos]|uniref:Amidohydro-rel domain-containing protein n=1 Tax=Mycena chlorophos TaxID=658473 RepID=A0A8H6T8R7_MYCCL|nr:Amidohydro-rel domain-containing protein [Mycena chlorophos]